MSITDLQDNKGFILDAHAMSIKSARELKTVHEQVVASMNKKMMKDFWLICKGAGADKANRWAMPCPCRVQAANRAIKWAMPCTCRVQAANKANRWALPCTYSGQAAETSAAWTSPCSPCSPVLLLKSLGLASVGWFGAAVAAGEQVHQISRVLPAGAGTLAAFGRALRGLVTC